MIGRTLGHYRIIEKLGEGGMGVVYKAHDTHLGRFVAIKFLPTRYAADADRLRRFTQEARSASSLNHPNIITIHEIGQLEGQPFLVMELVEGDTLRHLLQQHPLPSGRVLDIGSQLADGLAKAHAAGIVHRDLKPENVMITRDGFVKILDFGLAKLRSESPGAAAGPPTDTAEDAETRGSLETRTGTVLGTVGYMSPEQAAGRVIDHRSDQFSLGSLLYEMATGRRAFKRDSVVQTLTAIIEDEPEPLGTINPSFPAPARWVVERCLTKDPDGRYASTLDLARELRSVRKHIEEASASGSETATRRRGAWRWVLVAAAVVAILILLPASRDFVIDKLSLIPLPKEKRLAVLPVHNPGGTAEDRAASEGLQSYVVARLAELERFQGSLWVVPAVEVRRARLTPDVDVGRVLGVTLAVEITVQRLEGGTVISASLLDPARRRVLRATTRKFALAASLLDETVDAVVGMLDIELGDDERRILRAGSTGVAEASTFYAQALAHKPYEQARTALERYDQQQSLEQAITLFNAALERDARFALAHAGLGEAYLRLWGLTRDPEYVALAEKHSQRAVEMDSLVAEAWLTLGSLHAQTGKADEALADFRRAQARAPRNAEIFRERAAAMERLQRFDEAERSYLEAVKLRPDAWSTLSYYGVFLSRRGRFEEAEGAFRQALERTPDNARLWSNLGAVLNSRERFEEAEAAWMKSISIQPTAAAISNLAAREFYRGRYAEAARGFEKAVELSPLDYRIQNNLASACLFMPGQHARAVAEYGKTLELAQREYELDRHNPLPLATMAESLVQIGARSKARSLIEEALRSGPLTAFLMSRAAGVYEDLGDRAAALRWLDAALRAGYSRADVERSPTFRRLREDPRFAKIGIPEAKKRVGNKT